MPVFVYTAASAKKGPRDFDVPQFLCPSLHQSKSCQGENLRRCDL